MPPRRKAYSYTRFSRPEQSRGATRKRQSEAAAAFARDNDLDLDDSLRDEGVSAFRGRHRDPNFALGRFLARVGAGDIARGSVLLVESFDRLSREQVLDALTQFLGLLSAGIEVVTLIDGRRYTRESVGSDPTQLIISIIIMSRAYEESATKAKRVADAWRRKREAAKTAGQAMTARAPGWMRLVGGPRTGHYELIPERARIVRDMFDATIAGDGRRTISKRLNAAGEPTWGPGRSRASQWHDSYVAKILASPAAYGRCTIDGQDVEDYFPSVVDQATYWRAQAATSARSRGNGRTGTQFNNLLRGLARCASCMSSMVYLDKGKRSRPALVCSSAHAAAGCPERAVIPYDGIELIVAHAFAHFADAATFALDENARRAEADLTAAELRRDALAARRDNLIEAIETGARIPELKVRLDELGAQINQVERDMAAAKRAQADRVEMSDDIEDRMDVISGKVWALDPVERYRGRSQVNARLRQYLDHVVIRSGPKLEFKIKAEFEGIDSEMLAAYGGSRDDRHATPGSPG